MAKQMQQFKNRAPQVESDPPDVIDPIVEYVQQPATLPELAAQSRERTAVSIKQADPVCQVKLNGHVFIMDRRKMTSMDWDEGSNRVFVNGYTLHFPGKPEAEMFVSEQINWLRLN